MMRENRLKTIWDGGGVAVNCWLSSPSPLHAEMIGAQGFDSVIIDCQHGAAGAAELGTILMAFSASDTVPLVRVPWNDPASVMRALDLGAAGVLAPMINTRADAEALVRSCRYPPQGERSFGPVRAQLQAHTDVGTYFSGANANLLAIAQIETAQAMDNLDDILSTPGLDMAYVGPADLSISHGGPASVDLVSADAVRWHQRIVEAGRRHGVRVGLHGVSAEHVQVCADFGADLITVASDVAEMTAGTAGRLGLARRIVDGVATSAPAFGYGAGS
jgi:4-hydroxy-2-oxoheptanedioate aldolase